MDMELCFGVLKKFWNQRVVMVGNIMKVLNPVELYIFKMVSFMLYVFYHSETFFSPLSKMLVKCNRENNCQVICSHQYLRSNFRAVKRSLRKALIIGQKQNTVMNREARVKHVREKHKSKSK